MKALIRNEGETVTENMDIPCIEWDTGYPLTGEKWFGGPYTLVQNYAPPTETEPENEEPEIEENEDDYVVIDGKRYSKEELRKLIE